MKSTRFAMMAFLACAWAFVMAQDSPSVPAESLDAAPSQNGGRSAVDFIRIDSASPSVPLRNAGVVRNSETVELDGKPLKRGADYTLDYGSGMLILMVPTRPGQTVRVTYRHDPAEAKAGSQKFGQSWNSMKLNFGSGTTVMMGLGMAERTANGSVMRSDLYAMRNSFGLAPSMGLKMNGVLAFSNRRRVESQSLLGSDGKANDQEGGRGVAIVQDMAGILGGGEVSIQYQSIDRQFTGFNAFADSGFSNQQIDQLSKERGLKRVGLNLNNVGLGSLKLNQSFSMVGEKGQSIRTQNFGLQGQGWKLDVQGRKVDRGFSRFRDLREGDREQLQREAGLSTQSLGFSANTAGLKLNANVLSVTDTDDQAVHRFGIQSEVGGKKVGYTEQEVDRGFRQFQGLRERDAGQLAREQGIRRTSFQLEFGAKRSTPGMKLQSSDMTSASGRFTSQDLTLTGQGWSYDFASRGNDAGFDGPARQSEHEQNEHIARIASMYEPRGIQARPEERQWFSNRVGLDRTSHRLSFSAGKGLGVSVSQLQLDGRRDSGTVSAAELQFGNTSVRMRSQRLGDQLVELGSMMGFERERLGPIVGLDKDDFSLKSTFGKDRTLELNQMSARVGEMSAGRKSFALNDPKFQINYVERHVDARFFNVGQLVDPERELLGQIIGEEQRQLLVNLMLVRGLSVRMNLTDAKNKSLDQEKSLWESLVSWDVDKDTKLQWYRFQNQWNDPTAILADQTIDRMMLSRNFAGLGAVTLEREIRNQDGSANRAPDSVRNTFTVETKIDDRTSVRTEQSRTEFNDGNRETVSAHTVSSGVTKQAGVSVTDVNISRTGNARDERRRNYGFWLNLGGGIKFTYGFARQLGEQGTENRQFQVTGGQIGGLNFGGANYQNQQWDGQRNRSTGNFQLGTTKPMQFGFLRDFKFNIGTDTVRDYNTWQRENQTAAFGARIADLQLGFDYASQAHQSGKRAIDRAFRFATANEPTRKLAVDAMIKLRTMPWQQTHMIRNVSITGRFIPGLEIIHQAQSNPEQQRGDALLGSVVQPVSVSSWRINQIAPKANTRFGFSWEERRNDQTRVMTRMASLNLTLNANNPSPIRLFYGLEEGDQRGNRRTAHRYGIEFNQRPGPNQLFNLSFGNVSWQNGRTEGMSHDNWSARVEYQLRF